MFSRIINFIINYPILVIIILGGLFNVAVRISQKTKEQRARREAFNEISRQKQDTLRTGRTGQPAATVNQNRPQPNNPQAIRQQRIEALRQERMEQLQALRQKRAGAAQSKPSAPLPHPSLPPIPVQAKQPAQARSPVQPRRTPARSANPPQFGSQARPIVQSSAQAPTPPTRRRQPTASAPQAQRTKSKRSTPKQPVVSDRSVSRKKSSGSLVEGASSSQKKSTIGQSARSMLRSRSSVRQAIVISEILDAPIAMREQEIASGSILF